MTDKDSLNDIFKRYLNNECSTYEIKYLLKHFISGSNDAVLRELIAEELRDPTFDDLRQSQYPALFLDEGFKSNIASVPSKPAIISDRKSTYPLFEARALIKLGAIITLILLVLMVYWYV